MGFLSKALGIKSATDKRHEDERKAAQKLSAETERSREDQLASIPPPPIIQIAAASPTNGGTEGSLELADLVTRERQLAEFGPPADWQQPQAMSFEQAQALQLEAAAAQRDSFMLLGGIVLAGGAAVYFLFRGR